MPILLQIKLVFTNSSYFSLYRVIDHHCFDSGDFSDHCIETGYFSNNCIDSITFSNVYYLHIFLHSFNGSFSFCSFSFFYATSLPFLSHLKISLKSFLIHYQIIIVILAVAFNESYCISSSRFCFYVSLYTHDSRNTFYSFSCTIFLGKNDRAHSIYLHSPQLDISANRYIVHPQLLYRLLKFPICRAFYIPRLEFFCFLPLSLLLLLFCSNLAKFRRKISIRLETWKSCYYTVLIRWDFSFTKSEMKSFVNLYWWYYNFFIGGLNSSLFANNLEVM